MAEHRDVNLYPRVEIILGLPTGGFPCRVERESHLGPNQSGGIEPQYRRETKYPKMQPFKQITISHMCDFINNYS